MLESGPMSSLADRYQRELGYYRELLDEFGREHRAVAHMVDGRQADAAVERLLQGAALVTGHLRSRIEDRFSELSRPLVRWAWPERLRTRPALVALDARPETQTFRKAVSLRRGTPFRLGLIDRQGRTREYDFCTCSALELPPISLEDVQIRRVGPSDTRLQLRFAFGAGSGFAAAGVDRLRVQFVGPKETSHTLFWLMFRSLERCELRAGSGESFWLEPRLLRPLGFPPDDPLLPGWPQQCPGLGTLFEYFDLQSKFLGVQIEGLDRVPEGSPGEFFDVIFHLGAQAKLPAFAVSDFGLARLYGINVSEPRRLAARLLPEDTGVPLWEGEREMYSLETVTRRAGGKVELLTETCRDVLIHGAQAPHYELEPWSDVGGAIRASLRLVDHNGKPEREAGTVDVHLRFWDRALAQGSAQLAAAGQSSRAGAFQLKMVGPLVPPRVLTPTQLEDLWDSLALLQMRPNDLCSANGLRQLIRVARSGREGTGPEPEVLNVRWRAGSRVYRRTVVPVREVDVELAERSFESPGELFLFARVLSELFRRQGDSPAFWALNVRAVPSGVQYRFGPQ